MNSLAFNQDYSCLAVATDTHTKIFNCDPFGEFYSLGPAVLLKMLFATSLAVVVPSPRLLRIHNVKQDLKIYELAFPAPIIEVKLNRQRLCVVLEEQIYLYDLSCVRLVTVLETRPGAFVGDLASDRPWLVLPLALVRAEVLAGWPALGPAPLAELSRDPGWVVVYDTVRLCPRLVYRAHELQLARICVSADGVFIATASHKGTIVRICAVEEPAEESAEAPTETEAATTLAIRSIVSFRRGRNPARITCLAFSPDNRLLGCASASGTVHFFALDAPPEDASESALNKLSEDLNENLASLLVEAPPAPHGLLKSSMALLKNDYTRRLVKRLPYKGHLQNLWEPPKRSFAYIRVPDESRLEIGFVGSMQVVLASYGGTFYHYQLPLGHDERALGTVMGTYSL